MIYIFVFFILFCFLPVLEFVRKKVKKKWKSFIFWNTFNNRGFCLNIRLINETFFSYLCNFWYNLSEIFLLLNLLLRYKLIERDYTSEEKNILKVWLNDRDVRGLGPGIHWYFKWIPIKSFKFSNLETFLQFIENI